MLTPLTQKRPALKAIPIDNTLKSYSQPPIHSSKYPKNQPFIYRPTHTKKKKSYTQKSRWTRKPTIGSDHSHLTMDFFVSNNYWKEFKEEDQLFAFLFWTTRSNNHSLREIQQDAKKVLGVTFYRGTLSAFFREMENQSFVKKHYRYRLEKKAHRRNYYDLTVKGKAYMAALISFAIVGIMDETVVAPELKICGTVVKTPKTFMDRDWKRLGSDNSLSGKYIKKLYHHNRNSYSVRVQEKCQAYRWDFSFEIIKKSSDWLLFAQFRFNADPPIHTKSSKFSVSESQSEHQRYSHPWFDQTAVQESSIENHKHRALFEKFGYGREFHSATETSRNFWAKKPADLIEKALHLITKKSAKCFKYRSFEKFLCYLLKTEATSFYSMKSQLLRKAIDGNQTHLDEGVDTREIVDKIRRLEKETQQKLGEKNLERLMRHPTHLLKRALEAVEYRMKGMTPTDKPNSFPSIEKPDPIFETRWVVKKFKVYNPKTKTDEIREKKEKVRVVVGYKGDQKKPESLSPMERKRTLRAPIKSWIALLNYTINLGSIEAINQKFFQKRGK